MHHHHHHTQVQCRAKASPTDIQPLLSSLCCSSPLLAPTRSCSVQAHHSAPEREPRPSRANRASSPPDSTSLNFGLFFLLMQCLSAERRKAEPFCFTCVVHVIRAELAEKSTLEISSIRRPGGCLPCVGVSCPCPV